MVATGGVLLGMAGDMIDESDNRTHYMTKIGGSPWYPKLGSGPQQKIPTCDICGQDLALVLQGCGRGSGSWKATRVQLPSPHKDMGVDETANRQGSSGNSQQTSPCALSECKSPNIFNSSAVDESQQTNSPFEFADIGAMLNSMTSQPSGPPRASGKSKKRGSKKHQSTSHEQSCSVKSHQSLPEFHIWSQHEPKENSDRLKSVDKEHIKQLLTKYDQIHNATVDKSTVLTSSAPPRPPRRGEWDGEQYESTSAQSKPFRMFQKRMERSPAQCVRYGFGAEVLVPKINQGKIPQCSLCGSNRIFEMQTMPPLLAYISEAAEWAAQGGQLHARECANSALEAWGWASVAVFTCEQSCDAKACGSSAATEYVRIYNED